MIVNNTQSYQFILCRHWHLTSDEFLGCFRPGAFGELRCGGPERSPPGAQGGPTYPMANGVYINV